MRKERNNRNKFLPLLILEAVSAAVLIAALLLIKYFNGNLYSEIKEKHSEYFEIQTDYMGITKSEAGISRVSLADLSGVKKTSSENLNSFYIPLSGVISSKFGYRNDPFTKENTIHKGIDIASDYGTEISAVANGTVSYVGYDENGFGNYISLKHSETVKTLYGHCSEILVSKGESVKKGQIIAKVGSTGASTGNHLHFEIRLNNIPVDPLRYISIE